jgi:hypothetical protein
VYFANLAHYLSPEIVLLAILLLVGKFSRDFFFSKKSAKNCHLSCYTTVSTCTPTYTALDFRVRKISRNFFFQKNVAKFSLFSNSALGLPYVDYNVSLRHYTANLSSTLSHSSRLDLPGRATPQVTGTALAAGTQYAVDVQAN